MIFVYKITNVINGKFYIGAHEGEIDDNYWGSGKAIKAAIKKHGIENFKKEVLQYFETREGAYEFEKGIVTPELIESRTSYNLNVGGKGGWYHIDLSGDKNPMKRPDVAKKVSEGIKKSMTDEERQKRSERMKQMRADGIVVKPTGWKHSEESKKKMSDANKGKPSWNKGITGFTDSEKTKAAKSAAAKERSKNMDMGALTRGKKLNLKERTCPYCGLVGKGRNMTVYHFENCKKRINWWI